MAVLGNSESWDCDGLGLGRLLSDLRSKIDAALCVTDALVCAERLERVALKEPIQVVLHHSHRRQQKRGDQFLHGDHRCHEQSIHRENCNLQVANQRYWCETILDLATHSDKRYGWSRHYRPQENDKLEQWGSNIQVASQRRN